MNQLRNILIQLREEYISNLERDMEIKRKQRSKGVQSEYVNLKHRSGNKRIRTIEFESYDPNGSGKRWKQRIQIPELREIIRQKKNQTLEEAITTSLKAGNVNISCNCFTGDTLIPLLNGETKRLDEMKEGEEYWIYSSDENGSMVPKKAKSLGITNKVNKLYKITLDNGYEIKTTVEQEFRMRNGSYTRVDKLKVGDSLMPQYRRVNDKGYEELKDNNTGKWVPTHRQVARNETNLSKEFYNKIEWLNETKERRKEQGCLVTHHRDFNKTNNSPDNLQWMGRKEHWMYHANLAKDRLPDMKKLWKDPEYYKTHVEQQRINGLNHNFTKYSENEEAVRNGYYRWLENGGREFYSKKMSNPSEERLDKLRNIGRSNMKKLWADKEWVQFKSKHQSEIMKEYYKNNPGAKCKIRDHYQELDEKQIKDISKKISESKIEYWKDDNNRKKHSKLNKKRSQEYWNNNRSDNEREKRKKPEYQRKAQLGKLYKVFDAIIQDGKELNEENYIEYKKGKRTISYDKYFKTFNDCIIDYRNWNHKIKKIELLEFEEPIAVYDLNVPDTENFLLDVGIYVHNCPDWKYKGYEWMADAGDYGITKQNIAPDITNPDLEGSTCKHINSVFENIDKFIPNITKDLKEYLRKRRK